LVKIRPQNRELHTTTNVRIRAPNSLSGESPGYICYCDYLRYYGYPRTMQTPDKSDVIWLHSQMSKSNSVAHAWIAFFVNVWDWYICHCLFTLNMLTSV
jgi:hypothetical protein